MNFNPFLIIPTTLSTFNGYKTCEIIRYIYFFYFSVQTESETKRIVIGSRYEKPRNGLDLLKSS